MTVATKQTAKSQLLISIVTPCNARVRMAISIGLHWHMLVFQRFSESLPDLLPSLVLFHFHPSIGVDIFFEEPPTIVVYEIDHHDAELLLLILAAELLIVLFEVFNPFPIQFVSFVMIRQSSSTK